MDDIVIIVLVLLLFFLYLDEIVIDYCGVLRVWALVDCYLIVVQMGLGGRENQPEIFFSFFFLQMLSQRGIFPAISLSKTVSGSWCNLRFQCPS